MPPKIHPRSIMKIPIIRRPKGFTLVELLVVIAIIAVLASAGFAAGNAAIQKARREVARATAVAIESSVNNFYTEYGSMPKDGDKDVTVKTNTDTTFLKVLLGLEGTASGVLNTRAIKFLSAKEGKANKNGLIYGSSGSDVKGLYDPWGGPFNVILDLDYDEKVDPDTGASAKVTLNGRRVAVWSDGADGPDVPGGSKSNKASDDVKTWGN
jgi:prepilin-type N-terminal cleavage/methylation domain-containing protein